MNEIYIQRILAEYGTKLAKKINLRVITLIDPSARNPYEGMNISICAWNGAFNNQKID